MSAFDRFARFYDADYREYDEDIDTIVEFAVAANGPILELGCGTGRLLLPLAHAGCRVTGIDSSAALLEIARHKLARHRLQQRVTLVEADMRSFDVKTSVADADGYAFAFCTSNTFMHLTTQAEQQSALRRTWQHLAPNGQLLLALFNPDVRRLVEVAGVQELADRWFDEDTGVEVIKWSVRTVDWAHQIQETLFIYEEIFADGRVQRTSCPFTLRFLWRGEAELMLSQAGFILDDVWGSFEGDPYDTGSEQLILVARKPE